jgi:hypothetical protein
VKNGYPPQYTPEVFREVMDQVENFKENEQLLPTKLDAVEDDEDVKKMIFNLLHMNREIDDLQIQKEVI